MPLVVNNLRCFKSILFYFYWDESELGCVFLFCEIFSTISSGIEKDDLEETEREERELDNSSSGELVIFLRFSRIILVSPEVDGVGLSLIGRQVEAEDESTRTEDLWEKVWLGEPV